MNVEDIIFYEQLKDLLISQKISKLHSIQVEAINKGLFFHQNFLVCTPSGSGKTLIAQLAIANVLLKEFGKVIYLVPYKALATEKEIQFKNLFSSFDIEIKAITGDTEEQDKMIEDVDLIITTFEKCDALFRMKNSFLNNLKVVVIDEIHEIGESGRGARLELLITRLLSSIDFIQVIALSATIANYIEFSSWLSSFGKKFQLILAKERPIKLEYNLHIYKNKLSEIKKIVKQALATKGQIIVFVNKRRDCLRYCENLQNVVSKSLSDQEKEECRKAQNNFHRTKSIATILKDVVGKGIAYHNASLNSKDRKMVEIYFCNHTIKVLVATTTLAAGINTPARYVIVSDIIQYRKNINITEDDYSNPKFKVNLTSNGLFIPVSANNMHQMLGRAGRLGFDDVGKTFILLRNEAEKSFTLSHYFNFKDSLNSSLEPKYANLNSQLNNKNTLHELVLLLIYEMKNITPNQINIFLNKTFYAFLFQNQNNIKNKNSNQNKFSNLMQYLSIEAMDFNYYLKKVSPNYKKDEFQKRFKFQLNSIGNKRIEGKFISKNSVFYCFIDLNDGMNCSCKPGSIYYGQNSTNIMDTYSKNSNLKLCIHLSELIRKIYFDFVGSEQQKIISYLIPLLINHESVLYYLEDNNLISKVPESCAYSLSRFGNLIISLFIYPTEAINIKNILIKNSFVNSVYMIQKVVQNYCMNKNKKYNRIYPIINSWINEETVESILADHPKFGLGDLFSLTNEISHESMIFESICRYLLYSGEYLNITFELADKFRIIGDRIKYGVKEELINLFDDMLTLSRNKARIIFNSGFSSVDMVVSADPMELSKKTHLKLSSVKEIVGKIKKEKFQVPLTNYLD